MIERNRESDAKQMTGYFAPVIDKYFAGWILRSTWHKSHPCDEERFYRFVLAVHRLSRLVGRRKGFGHYLPVDDRGNMRENGSRNPRTYDKRRFKETIIRAVTRNHSFNQEALENLAEYFSTRAMDILNFLWVTRSIPMPDARVTGWDPPLR